MGSTVIGQKSSRSQLGSKSETAVPSRESIHVKSTQGRCSRLAQSVERRVDNAKVAGSDPRTGHDLIKKFFFLQTCLTEVIHRIM